MYKILFSLLFLLFSTTVCFADVTLISPQKDEYLTNRIVNFKWENTDTQNEYVYRLDIAFYLNWSTYMLIPVGSETQHTHPLSNYDVFAWRVLYARKNTFDGTYPFVSESRRFSINTLLPQEETPPQEPQVPVEKPAVEKKKVTVLPKTTTVKKKAPVIVKNEEEHMEWDTSTASVLGVAKEETVCRFKYLRGESVMQSCNIPPLQLNETTLYPFVDEYSVVVKGKFLNDISVVVDEYRCKREILKPVSFFKCNEELVTSHNFNLEPNIYFSVYQGDLYIPIKSFTKDADVFTLVAGYFRKREKLRMSFKYVMNISEFNISISGGGFYSLDPKNISNTKKPFSLPFSKAIGVTQWHGDTVFQKPHKGIDFGAVKESILAVSDGSVVGKGWDSYNGKCFSGGNYLLVKQNNGMYTTYFHLEKTLVNTGDRVKKGQRVGVSGNSGAWNCQKLGYHLHFETRKGRNQSTHVNPVDYINTDWSKIVTLNAKYIPERLSGDNPHPGY